MPRRRTKASHARRAKQLTLAVGTVLFLARPTFADDLWTGTTGDWFTSANWSAGVPTGSVPADFDNGTATIATGATATFLSLNLGYGPSGSGTITLAAGAISTSNYEYLGYNGHGFLTQTGGINSVGVLVEGYLPQATGTYTLIAGTLSNLSNYPEHIGGEGAGLFNQSGGLNECLNSIILSGGPGALGTYLLSGGTLNLTSINFGYELIGSFDASGTFNQSGGSNLATGLTLGPVPSSTGTFSLSGGTLSVSTVECIGQGGNGSFTQTGGANIYGGGGSELFLGSAAGSTGSYTLSAGTLSTGRMFGLGEYIGYRGTGSFTQSGGLNSLGGGNLVIAANPNSVGSYTITGGQLFAEEILVGTLGSSGALTIGNDTVSAPSATNFGTISLTGPAGSNTAGDLNISTYSQSLAAQLNIALAGLTAGTLYSVLTASRSATLAGTLNVTLVNGFVPSPGDTFDILDCNAITGTFSTVNLPSGPTLDLSLQYTSTGVVITDLPEPSAIALCATSALGLLKRRRRKHRRLRPHEAGP
jgi:hypothetical protein